ncbi:MAG: anaerobic ribonucleoside-triphosphate reductase activating protein [Clostridia bacterium]|nr:anaerobic ribonucleoside-triphosphate reductase activating protein [Clostridia bacterium]
MKIYGFQKMTLLDFPGKVACTVFTGGCNFRCPFCHNASLVTHIDGAPIAEEEILSYLNKRKGLLDGVCVTGGEPLLQGDIASFLRRIKEMGYLVKLDTNGAFPDRLRALLEAGLVDYVAMDIKNSKEKYAVTAGVPVDLAAIERSVELLKEGRVDYEFRTTLVKELHTEEDILSMAKWLSGAKYWYLQNFTDSGDLIAAGYHSPGEAWIRNAQTLAAQTIAGVKVRGC